MMSCRFFVCFWAEQAWWAAWVEAAILLLPRKSSGHSICDFCHILGSFHGRSPPGMSAHKSRQRLSVHIFGYHGKTTSFPQSSDIDLTINHPTILLATYMCQYAGISNPWKSLKDNAHLTTLTCSWIPAMIWHFDKSWKVELDWSDLASC